MHNAARLRVLKAREDHVATVLEDAKKRLADIIKDRATYKKLINTLMTQGLLQVCVETGIEFVLNHSNLNIVLNVLNYIVVGN